MLLKDFFTLTFHFQAHLKVTLGFKIRQSNFLL